MDDFHHEVGRLGLLAVLGVVSMALFIDLVSLVPLGDSVVLALMMLQLLAAFLFITFY